MKRDVLVLLTRAPGRVHVAEGLRAANGVVAGFDRHDVTVLFTEDGVYAALAAADREALNMADHLAMLATEGGRLVADAVALRDRGIETDAIAPDIEVVDGDTAIAIVRETDHTLDF